MNRPVRLEQAHSFASLLPSLLRRLTASVEDPVMQLPLAQLRVCGILSDGPQAISVLSRELGVSVSAMTQIADRMERARLAKRVPRDGDRRVRCLQLTPRGKKMMQRHDEMRAARMADVLAQLTPTQRQAAADALQAMIEAAGVTADGNGKHTSSDRRTKSSRIML